MLQNKKLHAIIANPVNNSGVIKSVEVALGGFENIKLYENTSDKIGSTNSNESLSSSLIEDDLD